MRPISGTIDESMVRMHSKLEEVAAQILETMGVQVKAFGEKNIEEIRRQLQELSGLVAEISKVAQLTQPFSDTLESLKAQLKGSWNLDPEKIDKQFNKVIRKLNGVGGLVTTLTKKAEETLQGLDRLGPGALKAGVDDLATKMQTA